MRFCIYYHSFSNHKGLQWVQPGLSVTQESLLCFAETQKTVSSPSCPCSHPSIWTPLCYRRPVVSAKGEGTDRLRACLPQGLGMEETRMPTKKTQNTAELGLGSLSKLFIFSHLHCILPKDSKHKLPGEIWKCHYCTIFWFLFLPLPPILLHKINAFFVSCTAPETGHVPHKGKNSVHRSHFFHKLIFFSLSTRHKHKNWICHCPDTQMNILVSSSVNFSQVILLMAA